MHRRGVTVSEALVVLGITAILIGLLVPAVQRAQQDARKQQCKNNLKMLGLALHNYHDNFGVFPPGWVKKDGLPGTGAGFGWPSMLTPYLDQAPLFNRMNFKVGPLDPANGRIGGTPLAVFRCPADRMPATNTLRGNLGTSNYSGNYGPMPFPRMAPLGISDVWPGAGIEAPMVPRNSAGRPLTGFFARNSSVRISRVTDGTSNTLLAAERSFTSGAGIWIGVTDNGHEDDALTDCSHLSRPNAGLSSYSSQHPGAGVHALIADGSVRFIGNAISSSPPTDPQMTGMWQRLSCLDDGQPVEF